MNTPLYSLQLTVRASRELLARAGLAHSSRPWVISARDGSHSIDYDVLTAHAHDLDLSEECIARIAASLATGVEVNLHCAIGYLTRDHAALVMTAIACASGHDRPETRITSTIEGRRHLEDAPALDSWT